MLALIDGDVIVYRAAFSVEHKEYWIEEGVFFRRLSDLKNYYAWNTEFDEFPYEYDNKSKMFVSNVLSLETLPKTVYSAPVLEPVENAYYNVDSMIDSILERTGATDYILFFTGKENFRKYIPSPYEYKGGRPDKPQYYSQVKDYIQNKYRWEEDSGIEADDLLGIYGTEKRDKCVICSVDKDLKQIPGLHYNLADQSFEVVNEELAAFNFWSQMLTGDRVDNIKGINGIGPARASKFLKSIKKEDWGQEIRTIYENEFWDHGFLFNLNKLLLYILRTKEEAEKMKENYNPQKQNASMASIREMDDSTLVAVP